MQPATSWTGLLCFPPEKEDISKVCVPVSETCGPRAWPLSFSKLYMAALRMMNAHLTRKFFGLCWLMMLFLVYAESMELWLLLLWFAFSAFTQYCQCFVASVNTKGPIMSAEEPFLEPLKTHYLLSRLTKYPNDSSVRRGICGDFC